MKTLEGNNIEKIVESITLNTVEVVEKKINKYEGLHFGSGGAILLCFYASRFLQKSAFSDLGIKLLQDEIRRLADKPVTSSIMSGVSGVGWLVNHLADEEFIDDDSRFLFEKYDGPLVNQMASNLKIGNYEFLNGAIGIGVYIISRLKDNPSLRESLSDSVELIFSKGIKEGNSIKFRSEQIFDAKKQFNLGLAHGMPSVLIYVATLYSLDINKQRCYELAQQIINYFLKVKSAIGPLSFPTFEGSGQTRLAWCYGDLGVGYSILFAGNYFNNSNWISLGISILDRCSTVSIDDSFVSDSYLCHGSSGVATVFSQAFSITNKDNYLHAKEIWLNHTLDALAEKSLSINVPDFSEVSLLNGMSGIALSLLTINDFCSNNWYNCILLK